jgi:hypothetical protein
LLDGAASESEGHPHQRTGTRPCDKFVDRRDKITSIAEGIIHGIPWGKSCFIHLTVPIGVREHADDYCVQHAGFAMVARIEQIIHQTEVWLALLWQNFAIDWRNWIPESDFQ